MGVNIVGGGCDMSAGRNLREVWNRAAELNLIRYLGYGDRIDEVAIKRLADNVFDYRLNIRRCGVLFNLGCGICTYDVYWSRRVNLVVALDISSKMVRHAKERLARFGISNVCLIVADIRRLPIRGRVADAIVSLGVLKHIPSALGEVMGEIARIAKAGCHIYINDLPHILHPEAWIHKIAIMFWTKILRRFTTGTHLFNPWHVTRTIKQPL